MSDLRVLDALAKRASALTENERRRLAALWRRQYGGMYAALWARNAAAAEGLNGVIAQLREAAKTTKALEGESTDRAEWEAACARQCIAETLLAVAVHEHVGKHRLEQRHIDALLSPWRRVVDPDLLASGGAAALPAGVRLEGAEDGRSDDQEGQQAADEHPEGTGGDPEHESSGNSVHESDVTE